MKKIIILLFLLFAIQSRAIETGRWAAGLHGSYSMPVGSLHSWFKPSYNAGFSLGQQYNDRWFLSGLLEFSRYEEENLSGYPEGKLELLLEHTAVMFDGKYRLSRSRVFQPYIHFGAGILYWKGVRGTIAADDAIGLPHIDEKTLQEYNWCFRGGLGAEFFITSGLSLQLSGTYRFVVGDLYPTMQPNIELEGVSGFQTINLITTVHYYF
ncbi:outer membrane beta-barrel protein [candidate division KSB1 bacterium]|nr:outer membrane beta-barrel protein [candidate division KSB1 bacterium]